MSIFNSPDQLEGSVKAFIYLYSEHQKTLDCEKYLYLVVTDYGEKFKVQFNWTNESPNDRAAWLDDHFFILKSEGFRTLEKYVNDMMDGVTKDQVIIHSKVLTENI